MGIQCDETIHNIYRERSYVRSPAYNEILIRLESRVWCGGGCVIHRQEKYIYAAEVLVMEAYLGAGACGFVAASH